jgi:hypothetical protein
MAHGREHWYTITQRPLPTGAVKRVYVISCSKCGRQAEQHAGMQTDDMRRKGFQRQGWDIGKWKNLHVCPECNGRAVPKAEVEAEDELPEPVQPKTWMQDLPRLQQAWALTYEDERLAFLDWLRDTYGDRYIPAPPAPPGRTEIDEFLRQVKEQRVNVPPPAPPPVMEQQHGSHIDSMPVEAPPPPIENPPAIEQLETPAEPVMPEEPGEAEDWYVNLMADIEKKKARRK